MEMLFKLSATFRRTALSPLEATSLAFLLAARRRRCPCAGTLGARQHCDSGANSRGSGGGGRRGWGAREGGIAGTSGLAGRSRSATDPSAPGPWSLFPDLAPGDREGRVHAPSGRVRRECGWNEKEVRVSGT